MDLVQQMGIRGTKKKQKFLEIIGNEGERVGGKRKMKPIPTGIFLSKQILKSSFFGNMQEITLELSKHHRNIRNGLQVTTRKSFMQ